MWKNAENWKKWQKFYLDEINFFPDGKEKGAYLYVDMLLYLSIIIIVDYKKLRLLTA